jgi:hypothetical protein
VRALPARAGRPGSDVPRRPRRASSRRRRDRAREPRARLSRAHLRRRTTHRQYSSTCKASQPSIYSPRTSRSPTSPLFGITINVRHPTSNTNSLQPQNHGEVIMFNPFDKALSEVTADDLEPLGRVTEGWYVEYKRELLSADRLAKSLCAFANAEGGWLFLGISAAPDNTAGSFPGLDIGTRSSIEDRIRQAANAHCSRPPMFETRFIEGPSSKINLAAGRLICTVKIPRKRTPQCSTEASAHYSILARWMGTSDASSGFLSCWRVRPSTTQTSW